MMSAMPAPTPTIITSLANPRIKCAAALRDRRERDRTGLTLVDGAREIRRALEAGADLVEVYVCESLLAGPDARAALDWIRGRDVPLQPTSEAVFGKLAFGERAEGLVAIARIPPLGLDAMTLAEDALVAVVEGVEKPGNLGAILRSADGAAVDGVVAASPRTDLFNPNTIRASAGTIFTVPLAAAPAQDVLAWLRQRGLRIVAARVDGTERYTEVDLSGPLAVVLGAEAEGLGETWSTPDIVGVRLPMLGVADSLNVSVTAAILFYEARRQRGEPARTTRG